MIYLIRHGQTDWNVQKRVMGKCDKKLNEKGREQAIQTKELLSNINFDLIICSPLLRAKETAQIINQDRNIKIEYDDRIIERDFGELEGLETTDFDFDGFWNYYKNNRYDKAENIQDFFNRIYGFLDDICVKYLDKKVLIVAHGGVSIPFNCYFTGIIPKESLIEAGLVLGNCQVAYYEKKC